MPNLSDLPNELLLKIIGHLPPNEILTTIRLLSKGFRSVVEEDLQSGENFYVEKKVEKRIDLSKKLDEAQCAEALYWLGQSGVPEGHQPEFLELAGKLSGPYRSRALEGIGLGGVAEEHQPQFLQLAEGLNGWNRAQALNRFGLRGVAEAHQPEFLRLAEGFNGEDRARALNGMKQPLPPIAKLREQGIPPFERSSDPRMPGRRQAEASPDRPPSIGR